MGLAFLFTERLVPYSSSVDGAYLVAGSVGAMLAFLCVLQSRVYTVQSLRCLKTQAKAFPPSLLVGAGAQAAILWTLDAAPLASIAAWVVAWLAISTVFILGFRIPLCRYVCSASETGFLARRVAVVGATERGHQIADYINAHKDEASQLVGIFDDKLVQQPLHEHSLGSTMQVIGRVADLVALSRRHRIDAIVIALPQARIHEIDALRTHFSCVVAEVYLAPCDNLMPMSIFAGSEMRASSSLGGSPVVSLMRPPLNDYQSVQKAVFDRGTAALALIVLAPVLLLIALAIKLDSRGPVLFRQPRMGFNNVSFTVFKFRSMYHHMADLLADRQTSRDDPRVTRVGRILRKLSFDELPQLMNVLLGDMSLVGPRPHAPSTKAEGYLLDDAVPAYAERHRIKPGITGWAQVNGARGEIKSIGQIEERVRFDLHYIKHWSLFLDIKILLLTVKRELISSRAF